MQNKNNRGPVLLTDVFPKVFMTSVTASSRPRTAVRYSGSKAPAANYNQDISNVNPLKNKLLTIDPQHSTPKKKN